MSRPSYLCADCKIRHRQRGRFCNQCAKEHDMSEWISHSRQVAMRLRANAQVVDTTPRAPVSVTVDGVEYDVVWDGR